MSGSRSGSAVAYRKRGGGGPVLAVRLIEDVCKMMIHGFLADEQFPRNLAIALAAGNQLEDSSLAPGQVGWKLRWLRRAIFTVRKSEQAMAKT